jgi:hypothetical protein
MATEQKAKGAALSRQPNKQFKTWLIGKLAEVAMAQQATVDAETLEYFAEMLAVSDPKDLLKATSYFCHRERETGETAFPSLPMFEGAVRNAQNARLRGEREQQEREDKAIRARHIEEHPEEYIGFSDFKELLKILHTGIAKKREGAK